MRLDAQEYSRKSFPITIFQDGVIVLLSQRQCFYTFGQSVTHTPHIFMLSVVFLMVSYKRTAGFCSSSRRGLCGPVCPVCGNMTNHQTTTSCPCLIKLHRSIVKASMVAIFVLLVNRDVIGSSGYLHGHVGARCLLCVFLLDPSASPRHSN